MQERPTTEQIHAAIVSAAAAVESSRRTRASLGRRQTPTRRRRLLAARQRCSDAAGPLRSYIGMIAWHDLPYEQETAMKDAVQKLRYERRQIDKMKL